MNWVAVNICVIIVGISALVGLPFYFKRKNALRAAREEFEYYLKLMVQMDKQYAPHVRLLTNNLNTINYWLKTGRDPSESEEDSEKAEKENRFFAGLMNPVEAKKWKDAVKKAKEDDEEDLEMKSLRVDEFEVTGMEPSDVDQASMKFWYSTDFGENIFYCVTPNAITKHLYRNVLFFTTARPSNIPLVYPYKYEGAQMLSLYKHPAQTVWFLQNWKLIREGLEGAGADTVALDESITNEFDL